MGLNPTFHLEQFWPTSISDTLRNAILIGGESKTSVGGNSHLIESTQFHKVPRMKFEFVQPPRAGTLNKKYLQKKQELHL